MANDNKNGESGVDHQHIDTLILTYNRATDHLDVGGKCNSLDLMLDMLARATRVIESKWRAEQVLALRQQLVEQDENARIAAAVRSSGKV